MPDDRRVLEGISRLIVDGTNFTHFLSRSATPVPAVALIGRLRSVVPPGVAVMVVLDGSPEYGLVTRQVASGVEVRYAGREPADALISRLADDPSPDRRAGTLVVTDDIELSGFVRKAGGRTVRNAWLADRLGRQRLSAPALGGSSSPTPSAGHAPGSRSATDSDDADTPRWSPGRGATRKRGNGRRRPSSER
jgi:hypothetical protein